jgi:nitrate/TMAO reductase-like tetraheme cytochrome c subunit
MGQRVSSARRRVAPARARPAIGTAAVVVALLAVGVATGCHRKAPRVTSASFTPSSQCRSCHPDVFRGWSESVHARAATNAAFRTAHEEYLANPWMREGGGPTLCLRCHQPVRPGPDGGEAEGGIGCDYCHSISEVRMEKGQPVFAVVPGATKFGPVADAKSPAHEVAFRQLFRDSTMCAGCHELVSPGGTPILSTYSEWQKSPARARGQQCQHCHMADTLGAIASARHSRRPAATINTHRTPGGHSPEQLRKAVALEIKDLSRQGDTLSFAVEIANVGAGHDLPTGVPTRRLVLTAEVVDGAAVVGSAERTYRREVLDAQGTPIVHDSRVFVATAKLGRDTRLKAGERRTEKFVFPRAGSPTAHVRVRLTYAYNPSPGTLPGVVVPFHTVERRLTAPRP